MPLQERRHRVFFALWPDLETAEHLHALAGNLVAHASVPGRLSAERNLHMTLAFVGSVDDLMLARLTDLAAGLAVESVLVTLDELGFWPRGGVVYAACRNTGPLHHAFSACALLLDELGVHREHRSPVPHVTLARNVRGVKLPRLGEPISWVANELSLVASELRPSGARYRTLASWPMLSTDDD